MNIQSSQKQCSNLCFKFCSKLLDLNILNQPDMNFNIKLALKLPVELTSPYMKINNKILTYIHHFESQDVKNLDHQKMNLSMLTSTLLPIDKTFVEPYIFRYSMSVNVLNQMSMLSDYQFDLIYLFNSWLLADLYLERKIEQNIQQYFQTNPNPQENFLFAMSTNDNNNPLINWDGMKKYVDFKQTLEHSQCDYATQLFEQHGQKISTMGMYFGMKNPLINYSINTVVSEPNFVPAIKYFQILVDVYKAFPNIQEAFDYYKVTAQQIEGYSFERFLLEFEFPADERNKENIYSFRKYALAKDNQYHIHVKNEPLAFVAICKHFKQCHGQEALNYTYDYCDSCDSLDQQCSVVKIQAIKNPQIYPLSQLKLCPIDLKFYDFFNSTVTRLVDRLIQWIRAGQLKNQLNINSNLNLIKDALCVSSVNPIYNYESLEVLGDSAMKYITSAYLFLYFLDAGEDIMTQYRTAFVKNSYLKKIPVAKNMHHCITGKMYYNKHMENYISQKIIQQQQNFNIVDSQLSDVYEALVGAVFQTTWSYKEVAYFMKQTNFALPPIKIIQKNGLQPLFDLLMENPQNILNYGENFMDEISMIGKNKFYPLPEYMEKNNLSFQKKDNKLTIEEFQTQILDYHFNDISLLEEALKYPNQGLILNSYQVDKKSYERLEFLGDAAMEVLVITNIYKQLHSYYYQDEKIMQRRKGILEKDRFLCPGMLHQTKTVLLDNGFMATMSLLHRFHEVVTYLPQEYQISVENHQKSLREEDLTDFKVIKKQNHILPKFYGDVWESVGAAVLLDGGWNGFMRVFGRMYKPFIKFVCQNVEEVYEYHQKENFACQMKHQVDRQQKI